MNRNQQNGAVMTEVTTGGHAMPSFSENAAVEAALWVQDGKIDYMRSMPSLTKGELSGQSAKNLAIDQRLERLNAVVVSGGEYALEGASIKLSGYGASDFSCRGAGLLAVAGSKVTMKSSEIVTTDAGRPATIATTGSVLKVYDSTLKTNGGELPPEHVPVIGPGMMTPPFPLGLGGNCRTHLAMDHSQSYFYNCDLYAGGWACLSTDASAGYVYVEADDCRMEISGNGYATYADNGCHVFLNRCEIKTGNMLAIQDGNSSICIDSCNADCEKVCFMLHGGMADFADTGLIRVSGGCLKSKMETFLAKSTNVDIYVKGADLRPKNGVILRAMETDDEFYAKTSAKGPDCYGVQLTLDEMTAKGNILGEDETRKICLSLDNASLTGKITGFVALSVFDGGKWLANADSQVTISAMDGVDAVDGVVVEAKSDTVAPGEYPLPSGGKMVIR